MSGTPTSAPEGPHYLEDFVVGRRFETGSYTVNREQIIAFAEAFDPQPFHLDETAALAGPLQGLAASGWHTASITMRLLVGGGGPMAGGIVGAGAELSWLQPVRPGDTLRVHSEVVAARGSRSRPDLGVVTLRSETRNQRDETVQELTSTLMVPRRPSPAPPHSGASTSGCASTARSVNVAVPSGFVTLASGTLGRNPTWRTGSWPAPCARSPRRRSPR